MLERSREKTHCEQLPRRAVKVLIHWPASEHGLIGSATSYTVTRRRERTSEHMLGAFLGQNSELEKKLGSSPIVSWNARSAVR